MIQPDGRPIPNPVPPAEIAAISSRGFSSDAITLAGLFMHRGERIEYVADAHTAPGAFLPKCTISYQIVLRGAGCQLDVAWYNATNPATLPSADDLYVLFSKAQYQASEMATPPGLACMAAEPCPLASHETTLAPMFAWKDQTYSADILTNPKYKGGRIGFALIGSGACRETHYSQKELNTVSYPSMEPWTTVLTWGSTMHPGSYYLGFEDAASVSSDHDFNDVVLFISGLSE